MSKIQSYYSTSISNFVKSIEIATNFHNMSSAVTVFDLFCIKHNSLQFVGYSDIVWIILREKTDQTVTTQTKTAPGCIAMKLEKSHANCIRFCFSFILVTAHVDAVL